MKTAEEIMIKHCTDNGLLNLNMGKQIISAMEEYAQQLPSKQTLFEAWKAGEINGKNNLSPHCKLDVEGSKRDFDKWYHSELSVEADEKNEQWKTSEFNDNEGHKHPVHTLKPDSVPEDETPFKDVYVEKNDPIRKKLDELKSDPSKEEQVKEWGKCDVCGCHPATLIINDFGTFCRKHVKYI